MHVPSLVIYPSVNYRPTAFDICDSPLVWPWCKLATGHHHHYSKLEERGTYSIGSGFPCHGVSNTLVGRKEGTASV